VLSQVLIWAHPPRVCSQESSEKTLLNEESFAKGVEFFNQTYALTKEFFINEAGDLVFLYRGGVRGTFTWKRPEGPEERVRIFADRLVVLTTYQKRKTAGEGAGKVEGGKYSVAEPRLYAEGNVRLETEGVVLETDAFYYHSGEKRGVFVKARGFGKLDSLTRLADITNRKHFSSIRSAQGFDMGGIGAVAEGPDSRRPSAGSLEWGRILSFRAGVLRSLDLQHFEGEGLVISNCTYGIPHLAVEAGSAWIYPAEPAARKGPGKVVEIDRAGSADETGGTGKAQKTGEKEETENREEAESAGKPEGAERPEMSHYIVETRKDYLLFAGFPVMILPPMKWNTKWSSDFPIRRILPGHSGKFGYFVDLDWNLNWFLQRTPLVGIQRVEEILDNSKLSFSTDYFSSRGFGWGPEGVWGKHPRSWEPWQLDPDSWNLFGEGGYYGIRDEGEDRSSSTPFEDPDRHWAHLWHRQSLPHLGTLDIEYSQRSDRNFLNEYFEPIAKEEKPQESLFYFRRLFRDNLAVTGLYKYRSDTFETVVERTPELKFLALEQPVARTGLYTGLNLQAADLRRLPADGLAEPSAGSARFDVLNDWAYPLGLGNFLYLRPFASLRYSAFERGSNPGDDEWIDRGAFGAGITASQTYSRFFQFSRGSIPDRWFNFTQMKHEVIPKVTYRNIFSNNVEPDRLIGFDSVDTVSTDERLELSLRNHLLARIPRKIERPLAGSVAAGERLKRGNLKRLPSEIRSILDFDASMDWFLHPGRDNGGDRFSFLDLDLTLRPNQILGLRSRTFLDPNEDLAFQRTDTSLELSPIPELGIVLGERFNRDLTTFTYTQWTVDFSRRYLLDFYYSYDFQTDRSADFEVRLSRIFHKWAFEVVYHIDFGENENHSFGFNFQPIELLESLRKRRQRDRAMRQSQE